MTKYLETKIIQAPVGLYELLSRNVEEILNVMEQVFCNCEDQRVY